MMVGCAWWRLDTIDDEKRQTDRRTVQSGKGTGKGKGNCTARVLGWRAAESSLTYKSEV